MSGTTLYHNGSSSGQDFLTPEKKADFDNKESVAKFFVVSYTPFTEASYHKLRLKSEVWKLEKNKQDTDIEGLLTGDLDVHALPEVLNISCTEELADGRYLPTNEYPPCPSHLLGKPIEEIDKYLRAFTFVTINTRFGHRYIYRFSAERSLFLFAPWNPIRKLAIRITTSQFFDIIILLIILTYCTMVVIPGNHLVAYVDYFLFPIFIGEFLLRSIAKGLLFHQFSHLREVYNVFDLMIIVLPVISKFLDSINFPGAISALRGLRVFRVFKTMQFLPGIRAIISTLISSFSMLMDVVILTLLFMIFYCIFANQVWGGTLKNKCVTNVDWSLFNNHTAHYYENYNDFYYSWITNETNWQYLSGKPVICGNVSGSGNCESGYVCLANIGFNPDSNYTNFDTFFSGLLSIFQLITLDNWESLYIKVIRANGSWHVVIFVFIVFFGSYYLINLMLAVVAMNYTRELLIDKKEKRKKRLQKKVKSNLMNILSAKKSPAVLSNKLSKTRSHNRNNLFYCNPTNDNDDDDNDIISDGETNLFNKSINQLGCNDNKAMFRRGFVERRNILSQDSKSYTEVEEEIELDPKLKSLLNAKIAFKIASEKCIRIITENDNILYDRNFQSTWKCFPSGYKRMLLMQNKVHSFMLDWRVTSFISLCIICNLVIAVFDYYPEDKNTDRILRICLRVFDVLFLLECGLKIFGFAKTFSNNFWNIFELVTSVMAASEFWVHEPILSLPRLLRLLKVLRLWDPVCSLMTVIFKTFVSLTYLNIILLLACYIFAVFGTEVLRSSYNVTHFGSADDVPRWNFNDFWHSVLMVFRIFCGEWVETMRDCLLSTAEKNMCYLTFLPVYIVGNLICLSLFLALLLHSIANNAPNMQPSMITENIRSIFSRFWKCFVRITNRRKSSGETSCETNSKTTSDETKDAAPRGSFMFKLKESFIFPSESSIWKHLPVKLSTDTKESSEENERSKKSDDNKQQMLSLAKDTLLIKKPSALKGGSINETATARPNSSSLKKSSLTTAQSSKNKNSGQSRNFLEVNYSNRYLKRKEGKRVLTNQFSSETNSRDESIEMRPCLCLSCYTKSFQEIRSDPGYVMEKWFQARQLAIEIINKPIFDYLILGVISASCISMCYEDIYLIEKPYLRKLLSILSIFYNIVFTLEMIIRMLAMGIYAYFTTSWTILDFFILVLSLMEQMETTHKSNFMVLRTSKAFRPLRTISRMSGLRILVTSLLQAIPHIFYMVVVTLVFWLIFSIYGVQLFKGKFYKCIYVDSGKRLGYYQISNKSECVGDQIAWKNSLINFDNVGAGMLALFQIATFEGWMEIMVDAADATEIDEQPLREANFIMAYTYLVAFIIVGSFLFLNLFIGIIIDNFSRLRKKFQTGYLSPFLSDAQTKYYHVLHTFSKFKPESTPIQPPGNIIWGYVYNIVVSVKLEMASVMFLISYVIVMIFYENGMSHTRFFIWNEFYMFFTFIFFVEVSTRLIAQRCSYFLHSWNVFDFLILLISLTALLLGKYRMLYFAGLFRIVRLFRLIQILRIYKLAKNFRKVVFALFTSLPDLFYVGILLLMTVFIYSVVGMNLFGRIRSTGTFDEVTNFKTFESSIILLIRLTTSGGWNEVLDALISSIDNCNSSYYFIDSKPIEYLDGGECCSQFHAIIYMVTFIFLTYFVITNMYIAIILENFMAAHEHEEAGVSEDDVALFYFVWRKYDPEATQFISYNVLEDFLNDLEEPLGATYPNEMVVLSFDLPIVEGEKLHCLDILKCLLSRAIGGVEKDDAYCEMDANIEFTFRKIFTNRHSIKFVSSVIQRKKEELACKTIQRAWRRFRALHVLRSVKNDESSELDNIALLTSLFRQFS